MCYNYTKEFTMTTKVSIRFFNDREVRAVWDEEQNKWFFSVLDVVGVLRKEDDYNKCRNYWKYLKAKLKKENSELVSSTTQLKLTAADGKKYLSDALDADGVVKLAAEFPSKIGADFIYWFTRTDDTVDGKSKQKAYSLFDSLLIDNIEVGTVKGLRQIHSYLFGGLYDFAGQIRTMNISKGGFLFASALYLPQSLSEVENMPENTLVDIVKKYVEMNILHPFMEGNGRSTRIWLDLMLKKNLSKCVDWSKINKNDYLTAMRNSPTNHSEIFKLIQSGLTDQINDRVVFMKGIDYSYYYEEN